MAGRRRVAIPPVDPRASYAPGGNKPKQRGIDRSELEALEAEEAGLKETLRRNKANSKLVSLKVPLELYRQILRIAQERIKFPTEQLLECLEIGVRLFDSYNTPRGAPRVMDHLPELRQEVGVMEYDDPKIVDRVIVHNDSLQPWAPPTSNGRRPFTSPISVAPIDEPEDEPEVIEVRLDKPEVIEADNVEVEL